MNYEDLKKVNETLSTMDIKGKDYVLVNERVRAFRMLYPEGTITTELLSDIDGVCTFKATASVDGMVLAVGHAQEKEAASFINKTSYIENCETSAVGRCLGFLGIGIDTSIASAEEVETAIRHQAEIQTIGTTRARALAEELKNNDINLSKVLALYKVEKLADLTEKQHRNIIEHLDRLRAM